MPNHVTHKIIFDAKHLDCVLATCVTNNTLDFEKLVPSPPHKYMGDLSGEDQKDFPVNWLDWNRENWGTKWDAYAGKVGAEEDGRAFLQFDTAWSIPYPIIAAFCNKFNFAFEHRYFDEGSNFWGVEKWGTHKYGGDHVRRILKRQSDPADETPLAIELKGWTPDEVEA